MGGQRNITRQTDESRRINRIKMIKRQMYGRANFDLLRKRILHTPDQQKGSIRSRKVGQNPGCGPLVRLWN